MNKTELIAAIAEKTELSKKDAEKALTAMIEAISEELEEGNKVQLIGFGSFEVKTRAARTAFNPQTKQPIELEEVKYPTFKAGKALKDRVVK